MKRHQAEHAVDTICRILEVSPSGYRDWLRRAPSARAQRDAELTELIRSIHRKSRGTYGAPRIHAELADDHEIYIGRKRVARLMRRAGIQGVTRRRGPKTTTPDRMARAPKDLVERDFTASQPNELWVADITYVPTAAGFLYLAVVLDAWSRRIVGWAMEANLRTELVLKALTMACQQRGAANVIHHSDKGSQYTSLAFGKRCEVYGVRPSTGSTGDCYDNAMCESFFASLECELIDRTRFHSQTEARREVFEYIEGWYNTSRRHSGIGYLSPLNFEKRAVSEGLCPQPARRNGAHLAPASGLRPPAVTTSAPVWGVGLGTETASRRQSQPIHPYSPPERESV